LPAVKLTVLILVLLTGSAAAEKVTLQPIAASKEPRVVGSVAVCKGDNDFLRSSRTKLDGHEVLLLSDCAGAHSQIAFETKDGWRMFATSPAGGFASILKWRKRNLLLHRVDRYVSPESSTSHVDLCAYGKDGVPSCGSAEVECPETGCRDPEIIKSALWLHAKGGRKRFPIE
jgi:hypothetical protein